MGKRGPKPAADSVLRARGSDEPQRRARKLEQLATVAGGEPIAPTWLTAEELAIWKRLAPTLRDMAIISVADADSLGRYCHALAEWISVTKELRGQPRLVKPESAPPYQNPLLKVRADLAKEIQSLEDRFGLTPAARMTLNVTAAFKPGFKRPTDPTPETPASPTTPIGGERFFKRHG
jgi:P27 family predicted phage terminase small subunit